MRVKISRMVEAKGEFRRESGEKWTMKIARKIQEPGGLVAWQRDDMRGRT